MDSLSRKPATSVSLSMRPYLIRSVCTPEHARIGTDAQNEVQDSTRRQALDGHHHFVSRLSTRASERTSTPSNGWRTPVARRSCCTRCSRNKSRSRAQDVRIHQMDPLDARFSNELAGYPSATEYPLSPDLYAEHIRLVKQAVKIPIIASRNGTSAESWLRFGLSLLRSRSGIHMRILGDGLKADEHARAGTIR